MSRPTNFQPLFDQLKTHLYILQSCEYNIGSFLNWLKKAKDKKLKQKKQELVWTAKARIIFVSALVLWSVGLFVLTVYFFITYAWYWALILTAILTVVWQLLLVVFLLIPTVLLKPFEKIFIFFYLNKARKKLASLDKIKIIGITGSYGKTSVKEFLATILKEKYNILVTPENINTPIGIARLILNSLNKYHEIFIVEMGAYRRGDIKKLCNLVSPRIGILTGINESHLEKFKTLENTIKTKFELIESLPKNGLALINGDDKRCQNNYERFTKCEFKLYSTNEVSTYQQLEIVSKFGIIIANKEAEFTVNLLGKHNILNILPGILIGEKLGLNIEQIRRGIKNIKPIPHRLQPTMTSNNILIIDDAYNGNPDGVMAAIDVLQNYKERRKIFATPGLVELGQSRGEVHKKIGARLSEVADLILLIQNSNTEFFLAGLKEKKYPENRIKIYDSSQKMQEALKNVLRARDVILFQNDWPDSYL